MHPPLCRHAEKVAPQSDALAEIFRESVELSFSVAVAERSSETFKNGLPSNDFMPCEPHRVGSMQVVESAGRFARTIERNHSEYPYYSKSHDVSSYFNSKFVPSVGSDVEKLFDKKIVDRLVFALVIVEGEFNEDMFSKDTSTRWYVAPI